MHQLQCDERRTVWPMVFELAPKFPLYEVKKFISVERVYGDCPLFFKESDVMNGVYPHGISPNCKWPRPRTKM